MLSILIPVYRFDYHSLLDELVIQCRNLQIDFEILVGDDSGYPDNQNPLIQNEVEGQVKIFKRTKPLGRSANRNDLASRACYRYLLFIDGDAGMVDKGYVKRYLDAARPGAEVICGGTQYASYKPDEKDLVLRWKYGSHREAIPAAKRKRNPYRSFSSFNFMIARELFLSVKFNEEVVRYGHEDTLFGLALKDRGVAIVHIENALEHLGLEPANLFLMKSHEAIENLLELYRNGTLNRKALREIGLLHTYEKVRKFRLQGLLRWFYRHSSDRVIRNLQSRHPCLLWFDWYKLGYLLTIG